MVDRSAVSRLRRAAAAVLFAMVAISVAVASPPYIHESKPSARLDLRLSPLPAIGAARDSSGPEETFSSSLHRLDQLKFDRGDAIHSPRSSLDQGELGFRPVNPVEAIASRIRREGLPIARLWQSKSALLSIGLNQKGKPGLWLIKKFP